LDSVLLYLLQCIYPIITSPKFPLPLVPASLHAHESRGILFTSAGEQCETPQVLYHQA
jgi:hypothetical protein